MVFDVPGAVYPEDMIPDGQSHARCGGKEIRMGTVAAFLGNVRALHAFAPGSVERHDIWQAIETLAPKLKAMGLFTVFAPIDPEIAAFVESLD